VDQRIVLESGRPDVPHGRAGDRIDLSPAHLSPIAAWLLPEESFWAAPAQRERPARPVTSAFVGVEVRGFEPLTSSVRVRTVSALCGPAFPQVALDRQGRS